MKYQRPYKKIGLFLMLPILIGVTALGGCATTGNNAGDTQQSKVGEVVSEHKETAIGATLLGIVGAGVGYAVGGPKGAAIGGGTGLVLGAGVGQVIEHKDKKRTESVSEAGHRPEQDDSEIITRTDGGAEGREGQPQLEVKQVAAVAEVTRESKVNAALKQTNKAFHDEKTYDILRNGNVIGSIMLDGTSNDAGSLYSGSLSLCQASASESCARLELRKH